MSDVERFRNVPWYPVVLCGVFLIVAPLELVVNGLWSFLVVVGVVAFFACGFVLFPFEATVGPDGVVTFRAVFRRRTFYIEDVQRIERDDIAGAAFWRVRYVGGVSGIFGNAGRSLAQRLCQLNPTIESPFDEIELATAGDPRMCCSKAVGKPDGRHFGPCAND